MTAPTYNETLPARRYVVKANASDLLEMLGLITDDGDVPPDDTNVYVFKTDHAGKAPGARNANGTRTKRGRDRSAVPPGLRVLPPEPVEEAPKKRRGPKPQPKVIRPKKPRQLKPCGTYAAYSRHRRVDGWELEQIRVNCPACYEACLAYGRDRKAGERAQAKKDREQAEAERLRAAGVKSEAAIKILADAAE